ncbi:hypothetical protein B481_2451 [Planococcus halocryophilus Or1]|uniref:DUF2834 domain-containing protein n=1 Tax=Planococcus halocryophilus TaxID=1215089 RepID=A0A1C7DS30_9BACL|nr:hypothetical protein [Planococcus halocryophilus]ANU14389.1 hypothetical protein BBI08_11140 [Planococcus halocryophilus]EMF46117.1 hypothetical protein B481_2451 [Planococcus halocryophilus Or1]
MIFLIVWLLLIGYAVFLAPGGETDPILSAIFSGDLGAIDPLVLAVFNALGLFPMMFVTLLFLNDRQKWPAWPFALLSFGIGAFALLPYFAFGNRKTDRRLRTPVWLVRFLSSRFWLVVLMLFWVINALTLLQGFSLAAYQDAFFSSSLVSVMTVDWFVLWGLSVYSVYHFYPKAKRKSLAWIPILGPILVLYLNKKSLR